MERRFTRVARNAVWIAVLGSLPVSLNAQSVGTPKAGVPTQSTSINVQAELKAIGCLIKEGDRYVVQDAAVEVVPWMAPTLSREPIGPRKPSTSKTAFVLQNQAGLEAYVGQRIEVTGIVAPATANLPPSPDTIAPPGGVPGLPQAAGPGGQGVNRVAHPEIDNKTVKVISGSCSR
jgi:hypothetical protein